MHRVHTSTGNDLVVSSTGVLLTRVASAAARRRIGQPLQDVEAEAVRAVLVSLRSEIEVLQGRRQAEVVDAPAFAMAGFALEALSNNAPAALDDSDAVRLLEQLVGLVETLLAPRDIDPTVAQQIQNLFLDVGRSASMSVAHSGERAAILV